jgi:hypothetical protein
MRERALLIVGLLVVLLLFFPLGYLVHISPRFPGSLSGSLLGMVGAALILVALAFPIIKRVPWLKDRVTRRVSMSTLLAIHIYAGVLGPLLALVHSAHKFVSPLGISLVVSMIVVVLSGYVGRFLLARLGKAIRSRGGELAALQTGLAALPQDPPRDSPARPIGWRRLFFEAEESHGIDRTDVALALADAEYAVRSEQALQSVLQRWLNLHIIVAVILSVLLVLHIWAGLYFGLRWL